MPTINSSRPAATTPPPSTGATTATTATTATSPSSGPSADTATWQPPPLRSASGDIIPTRRVQATGLGAVVMNATNTTSRFSRDTAFDSYTAKGDGAVDRAFIRTDVTPIPGGCRVQVQSFHKQQDDKVTLYLLAEVLDAKTNELRTITISVLAHNELINPGSYRGNLYFDINYADINKFLQQRNPNLKLNPGHTSLAVAARWENGHQAGGFGRGGVFRLPPDGSAQSVIGVRTAARTGEETDLPLDMQVAYPERLVASIPQLKNDGNIVSRLESELKGSATKEEMNEAISKMYGLVEKALAGDTAAVEKVLGKGWTVETVSRYWLKDDGSANQPGSPGTGLFKGYRVDEDGLPIQDPMRDTYMDDDHLGMTRLEGAIRLRENKQATVMNVKPGGGRADDRTGIRQRIEYGLEMKPGTSAENAGAALRNLSTSHMWSGTVFNQVQREVAKLGGNVVLANALKPWLEVEQDRHKFTLKNKDGVEIELSFDKVKCKTLRPNLAQPSGAPRQAEFYVLEAELDHLQLSSSNQGTYAAANTSSSTHFQDDAQQDKWLSATSEAVTLDIDPRLHELRDLENASFRSTGSYKAFERAAAKVVPWLFPKGLGAARQKAAHAAEVLGLVQFDDKALLGAVRERFEASGYKWSDELQQKYETALATPAKRVTVEQGLLRHQGIYMFLWHTVGDMPLEVDVGRMKARVAEQLRVLGYTSSAEIEAMFEKLPEKKLTVQLIEQHFEGMGRADDAQVMAQWAQALGVSPAPVPGADGARTFAVDGPFADRLLAQLEKASIDKKGVPEILVFFEKAFATGAVTVATLRKAIDNFGANAEASLDKVATTSGLSSEKPTLRADASALVSTARPSLAAQFIRVDDAFERFMAEVSARSPRAEALQLARSLARDARAQVEAKAAALGITPPELAWDFPAIDAKLLPTINSAKVSYTPELRDFVHALIRQGVSVALVERAVTQLQSQPSLQKICEGLRIDVSALTVPPVVYDKKETATWAMQSLSGYQAILGDRAAFEAFTEECLAKGLTPSQVANYARFSMEGPARASRYVPAGTIDSLPLVPIDLDQLLAHWEKRFGAEWTPERAAYLREAFPKAHASPSFNFLFMFNSDARTVLQQVEAMSGVPRPSGV